MNTKTLNRTWKNTHKMLYLSDVFRGFTLRLRQKKLSKLLSLEIIEPEEGKKNMVMLSLISVLSIAEPST